MEAAKNIEEVKEGEQKTVANE